MEIEAGIKMLQAVRKSRHLLHCPPLGEPEHSGPFCYTIMLYYRCNHCGKRIARGEKCGCHKREHTAPEGTRRLYHSAKWAKLRDTVLSRYDCMDPYALAVHQRIEIAEVVHHITPAEEDPSLFWTADNLIPLSRHSHDEVHTAYRADDSSKTQTQSILRSLVKRDDESLIG